MNSKRKDLQYASVFLLAVALTFLLGKGDNPVSYTHLDVYKRQVPDCFAFYLLSRYGMNYHEGTCLIDLMMHTGKIKYVVQNLSLIHI